MKQILHDIFLRIFSYSMTLIKIIKHSDGNQLTFFKWTTSLFFVQMHTITKMHQLRFPVVRARVVIFWLLFYESEITTSTKLMHKKIGTRNLVSIICCKFALNNWFYDVFHPQLFDVVSSLRSNILALNHQVLLMIVLILCSIYFSLDNWQHEKWFLRFSMSRKTYKHSWKS